MHTLSTLISRTAVLFVLLSIQFAQVEAQTAGRPVSEVTQALMDSVLGVKPPDSAWEGLNLPSARQARIWSSATTLAPVAAGGIVWKLQSRRHIQERDAEGRVVCDYYKDPDRTLPIALVLTGIIIGPSSGYIYGGCSDQGIRGIGLRLIIGGAALGAAGLVANASSGESFDFGNVILAISVGGIGALFVVGYAALDIQHVEDAVRQHNARRASEKAKVSLTPGLITSDQAPGLSLHIAF